jgi:hypothetical protein
MVNKENKMALPMPNLLFLSKKMKNAKPTTLQPTFRPCLPQKASLVPVPPNPVSPKMALSMDVASLRPLSSLLT